MRVGEVMTRGVEVAGQNDTLRQAAGRMAEDGVPVPTVPADQDQEQGQGPAAGERVVVTVGAPAPDVPPSA